MFQLFKKRRQKQQLQAVKQYITDTYHPDFPNDDKIQYSLRRPKGNIRYSARNGSANNANSIPNSGDQYDANKMNFTPANLRKLQLQQLLDNNLNLSFVSMLQRYIKIKDFSHSKVYKAAQMDRRLFSKIISDIHYKPSKDTAISLCMALELTLVQTNDLLSRAGYTLSHSNKRDIVIEYYFKEQIHNLDDLNAILFQLGFKTIGR